MNHYLPISIPTAKLQIMASVDRNLRLDGPPMPGVRMSPNGRDAVQISQSHVMS